MVLTDPPKTDGAALVDTSQYSRQIEQKVGRSY
jgi:hypothetical protein